MDVVANAEYLKEFLSKWLNEACNQEELLEITSDKIRDFFKKLEEQETSSELIYQAAQIIGSVKINEEGDNIFSFNQDIEFSLVDKISENNIISDESSLLFNGKEISRDTAMSVLEELGIMYTTLKIALIFNKNYDDKFIGDMTERFVNMQINTPEE